MCSTWKLKNIQNCWINKTNCNHILFRFPALQLHHVADENKIELWIMPHHVCQTHTPVSTSNSFDAERLQPVHNRHIMAMMNHTKNSMCTDCVPVPCQTNFLLFTSNLSVSKNYSFVGQRLITKCKCASVTCKLLMSCTICTRCVMLMIASSNFAFVILCHTGTQCRWLRCVSTEIEDASMHSLPIG